MESVVSRTRSIEVRRLGRIGYEEAWALQREAAGRVAAGGPETLFLLEHDPVFTLGRNATSADVLYTPERCRQLGDLGRSKAIGEARSRTTARASSWGTRSWISTRTAATCGGTCGTSKRS